MTGGEVPLSEVLAEVNERCGRHVVVALEVGRGSPVIMLRGILSQRPQSEDLRELVAGGGVGEYYIGDARFDITAESARSIRRFGEQGFAVGLDESTRMIVVLRPVDSDA